MKKLLTLAVTATLVGGINAGGTAHALQKHDVRRPIQAVVLADSHVRDENLGTLVRSLSSLSGTANQAAPAARRPTAQHRGRWRGACSTWEYGERLTPARWNHDPARGARMIRRLVTCVFDRFAPGNSSHALYIASRESGLYPWAQNTSSLCSGLFQHILSAWPSRAHSYLQHALWAPWVLWPDGYHETRLVFDPRANAIAAAKMVAGGGWSPWGG